MSVRPAAVEDMPRVIELAREFHAYGVWRDRAIDPVAVEVFLVHLVDQGVIFLGDTGMLGGMLHPLWFSPSVVLAVELFWWAPTQGKELRQAFEAWGKESGAAAVQFSAMSDDQLPTVTRLYRMGGFRPIEVGFLKEYV